MARRGRPSIPLSVPDDLEDFVDIDEGQGVDLLEKRGWDDRAGDMIEA